MKIIKETRQTYDLSAYRLIFGNTRYHTEDSSLLKEFNHLFSDLIPTEVIVTDPNIFINILINVSNMNPEDAYKMLMEN